MIRRWNWARLNRALRKLREGKQRYAVQYQNLRVDFDIELCTHACPRPCEAETEQGNPPRAIRTFLSRLVDPRHDVLHIHYTQPPNQSNP